MLQKLFELLPKIIFAETRLGKTLEYLKIRISQNLIDRFRQTRSQIKVFNDTFAMISHWLKKKME